MEFEDTKYDNDAENAVESFDIELFPESDLLDGFHTRNDPEQPFQRTNVIQRKGAVAIKCSCIDIVHGKFAPTSNEFVSLLVLLFRFDPSKRDSRITEVNIEVKFFDGKGNDRKNPEVLDISLNDSYSLVPTKRAESLTYGANGTLGGSAVGATLSGTLSWEKKIEQETSDATHVSGAIYRLDATYGPDNAAAWLLRENESLKTGVPVAMRVGILVKRQTDEEFKCTVDLKAKTDFMSSLGSLFGGREKDDPILFKPSLPPTNKLMKYDTENLGSFDVTSIEDVTFTTIKSNAIKTV